MSGTFLLSRLSDDVNSFTRLQKSVHRVLGTIEFSSQSFKLPSLRHTQCYTDLDSSDLG